MSEPLGHVAWESPITANTSQTTAVVVGDVSVWCDERIVATPGYAASCVATLLSVEYSTASNVTANVTLVTLNVTDGAVMSRVALSVAPPHVDPATVPAWPSFSGWIACQPAFFTPSPAACDVLVTSTAGGIFGVSPSTAQLSWQHTFASVPPEGTPSHCTIVPERSSFSSVAVCTVESGRKSSHVLALNVWTGALVWRAPDQGFTLVWPLGDGNIAYGGRDPATGSIAIVSRLASTGALRWRTANMTFSPPGLWDNPNLDVDADPVYRTRLFLYSKPDNDLRQVSALDASDGSVQWTVDDRNATDIADYDTYARDGDFFRLRVLQRPDGSVWRTTLERLYGADGVRRWESAVPNMTDANALLMVGAGHALVFAVSDNVIAGVRSDTGAFAGSYVVGSPISSGKPVSLPSRPGDGVAASHGVVFVKNVGVAGVSPVVVCLRLRD